MVSSQVESRITEKLDSRVQMGAVTLTVADLGRSLAYYQDSIGVRVLAQSPGKASLGAGKTALVHLVEQPGARPAHGVTGLYHFALRVPTRLALARVIQHIIDSHTSVTGASDHAVSEALYLSDPDGHGIEIYRDRPRETWADAMGRMTLVTEPMDIDGVMAEMTDDAAPWKGIDPETVMGHVHLHVADLAASERFYLDLIGFDKPFTSVNIPSASFVSAGGYHHHLGMNIWAGAGAPPPSADHARMLSYEVLFPDEAAIQPVLARLAAAGVPVTGENGGWRVEDPSRNPLLLKVG